MNDEGFRPRFHFTPRTGWINDPLGPTFHHGAYHLFFQHVPHASTWAPEQTWGHATSTDLLHWHEGPVALTPGDGDGGIWSGSVAVGASGDATIFYTTVDVENFQIGQVRAATPADGTWNAWMKGAIVASVPYDLDVVAFRDPYVFFDGVCWRMLLGAGLTDGTAIAVSYWSDDLNAWTYDGILAQRHRDEVDPVWTGAVWECPQLFRLDDRWVLTVSVWEPEVPHYEAYAVGDLVDGRFVAESWGRLTYGPSYYAGSAFADRDGVRGIIYWLRDVAEPSGAWTGAHSVPQMLRIDEGKVVAEPHRNVTLARRPPTHAIRAAGTTRVDLQSDLVVTLDRSDARARMQFDDDLRIEIVDGQLAASTTEGRWSMPVDGTTVRVLLDGPIVEIFTGGGVMALPVPTTSAVRQIHASGAAQFDMWSLS